MVLLPKNPASLLNFFPSPTLALHAIIRIVWVSQRRFTDLDF